MISIKLADMASNVKEAPVTCVNIELLHRSIPTTFVTCVDFI